jgi:hypothetical protein
MSLTVGRHDDDDDDDDGTWHDHDDDGGGSGSGGGGGDDDGDHDGDDDDNDDNDDDDDDGDDGDDHGDGDDDGGVHTASMTPAVTRSRPRHIIVGRRHCMQTCLLRGKSMPRAKGEASLGAEPSQQPGRLRLGE